MTVAAVHQFISTFVPRDAVSMHTLELRGLLHSLGVASEIFVRDTWGEMRHHARPYRSYEPDGPAYLLYQAATGSSIADFVLSRPEPKLVNYHNLTPARFFSAWEPQSAVEMEVGRRQVADLAPFTVLGMADSTFNELDLREWGFAPTTVTPVLLDPSQLHGDADAVALDRLLEEKGRGGANLLFVGRVAPNKAQHDLVKALALYRRLYDPDARLDIVGSPASGRYDRALRGFVATLDLEGAVRMPGSLPDGELVARYQAADVFVCLSEHEGFCVPLLEAMHHGVPIVAYAAAAVPETLGGAGVLLTEKDPATVAAAVHRVVTDRPLRDRLVEAGRRRLADFSLARSREGFREALEPLLEGG